MRRFATRASSVELRRASLLGNRGPINLEPRSSLSGISFSPHESMRGGNELRTSDERRLSQRVYAVYSIVPSALSHSDTIVFPFCSRGECQLALFSVRRSATSSITHLQIDRPYPLIGQMRRVRARAHREVYRIRSKLALEEREGGDGASFANE